MPFHLGVTPLRRLVVVVGRLTNNFANPQGFDYLNYMEFNKNPVQFFTAVCNDWLKLLSGDSYKEIIIDALKFRIKYG